MIDLFSKKKEKRKELLSSWGKLPKQEYTNDSLQALTYYYQKHKDSQNDIDDITWNDLDMDSFFISINQTCSSMGEEYLYSLLRKPYFDEETQHERDRIMDFFEENPQKRVDLMMILSSIGKVKNISLYEYMNRLESVETESNAKHFLLDAMYPLSVFLIFVRPLFGIILLILTIITSVVSYFSGKAKISSYYNVIVIIMKTLKASERLKKFSIPELQVYKETILLAAKKLRGFHKGGFIVTAMNGSGNIIDLLLDYVRILTHADLILFSRMIRLYRKETKALNQIYEGFGFLDSLLAAASFRKLLGKYSKPVLVQSSSNPMLEIKDLYHPMIQDAISNSISTKRSILITGSNASGKSTFLKTVAINAILAQTIDTAICQFYKASFFRVASSMALTDNLFGKESYYIVETKSLKRILDLAADTIPMLCFIDEVLRGTNTLERIAASGSILSCLSEQNCICFAATHDLELSSILQNRFDNYHFQEEIVKGDILFDYHLYEGCSNSKNAIKLLELLGYKKEIIDHSYQACEHFLKYGSWKIVESSYKD